MSNVYFEVYRKDTMRLARTVVIKFEAAATILNERLAEEGIVSDELNPKSWKYYMNLAGDYHPTDSVMQVRSMDTLEIIDFTKDNLAIHRATAREYIPGSVYYNNLVRQFPDQVGLINGIIYPIDIQKAIDSNNGEILYYDPQYVEENEDNFDHELQDWVTAFYNRWYNEQFNISDDMYFAGFLGSLYTQLPLAIMLIRLRNARTRRANSFFIREWLGSNSRLDEFMPYLDKKQQLHLYRDINWYERNVGKESTWQRLVDNILTPRGIPLIWYNIKQNASKMPGELKPEAELIKLDVNFPVVHEGQDKTTVELLLERESGLARDNPLVQFDAEKEITEKIVSDQYSSLPTKVLDSEVIDRSTSSVRSHMNVLINQWLDLSARGKYRAYVQIPNPRTGELMTISVKDAFIMMLYAYIQVWEWDVPMIPSVVAYEVMRDPLPTLTELKTYVSPRVVGDNVLTAIQDRMYPMTSYISTEQFYLDATRSHKSYLRCWELYSFQEHKDGRAMCENAVKAHYMNRTCRLVKTPTSFDDYFLPQGIDIRGFRQSEYEQLVTDCINIATGANLFKVITLGEIQRELLRLMKRLSSYPLQYLRNVAYTNFHVIGMPSIRLGDYRAAVGVYFRATVDEVSVQGYRSIGHDKIKITDKVIMPDTRLSADGSLFQKIDPTVYISDESHAVTNVKTRVPHIGMQKVTFIVDHPEPTDNYLEHYQNSTDPNYPDM
ncbi:virion structural protein [Pseudomonas phage Psa21]|uniref:Virion structural protein n=1 Tax=Pseudomonas phage Psa21 TaxID=2530023 RepID=A0A481W616_9CAUD|nr:virion structural protein [Pseudomonas phage Psa21]QBJ02707.1 virion structural protein [Pseudomonas phage Psa21]